MQSFKVELGTLPFEVITEKSLQCKPANKRRIDKKQLVVAVR